MEKLPGLAGFHEGESIAIGGFKGHLTPVIGSDPPKAQC